MDRPECCPTLVQVDVALWRSLVGIFFGLPQQFVEFRIQHLAVRLLGFELFAENLIATSGFALEFGDCGGEIFDGRRFLRNFVGDNSACFRINPEGRLAARALDVEQAFCHTTIVAQRTAEAGATGGALNPCGWVYVRRFPKG
jgi:hypothetical protein